MSQKRSRSINWDEEEKQLFRNVMRNYSDTIENKSLTTNNNKSKTKAWEEVHKKFNELNSRPRELNQLKIQWKGMKINARKALCSFKKESKKTGGGPKPPTPDDSFIQIEDLLNPAELLRDDNLFDSDGPMLVSPHENKTCEVSTLQDANMIPTKSVTVDVPVDIIIETSYPTTIEDIDAEISAEKDCELIQETVNLPKAKKRPVIRKKLKSTLNQDHNEYVTNLVTHSKLLKNEEHRRRMEMAEEEHLIKMEIHKEKLRSAILERQILELKKSREENNK